MLAVLQLEEQPDYFPVDPTVEWNAVIGYQLPHKCIDLVGGDNVVRVEPTIYGLLHLLGGQQPIFGITAQCGFYLAPVVP